MTNELHCLSECYYCAENKGVWCKICQQVMCESCHEEREIDWKQSEYLSPHQWYEQEILV